MEEIPSYLYPGLAQLQKRSGSEGKGGSQAPLLVYTFWRPLSQRGDAEVGQLDCAVFEPGGG